MSVISSGTVAISSGVTSTGLLVLQEGVLQVLNKGLALRTDVFDGGQAFVSSGGIMLICNVSSGGTTTVLNSGYAQNVTVENGGLFLISSGGTATKSFIQSGGTQIVYHNVAAASAFVMDGGTLHVSNGGFASAPVVSQGGIIHVWSGGLTADAQINGLLKLYSSATAGKAMILDGGRLDVLAKGYAYNAEISSGGVMDVASGGAVNFASVFEGGEAIVSAGGSMTNAEICGGKVTLEGANDALAASGAYLSSAVVDSGGRLIVSDGATAVKVKENGGYVEVADGASVLFSSSTVSGLILSNASATVHSGTTAVDVEVGHGGLLTIFSGGKATNVAENGGYAEVGNGAEVSFVSNTISGLALDNASATVHSGTTLNSATVGSGGKLEVFSGGKMTGLMTFEDGAVVSASMDAILDFDISPIAPEAGARVNNLAIIQDTLIYTLTVSAEQAKGIYTLAEGAADFNGTLTVRDTLGESIGTLTVTDRLVTANTVYTLNAGTETAPDALLLTVAPNERPTVSNIQASITTPTSQDVVITAEFADDVGLAKSLYRIGETDEWTDYVDGVVVTENATVYFKAVDITGNESEIASYEVTNIDRTGPVITLSGNTETTVRQTTLTAEADDGSEIYFRISEFGVWKKYTGPVIASFNETYYFKATDEAGNEGTNQITFGNIDTTGILLSTLWTQKGVCPMGGNTEVCYDEYTPLDPSVTPDTHSLVGCVNVAVGQLIYYFIEKQGLELALTLNDSDEYTSSHKADEGAPIVIEIKSDGSTPGTLSFAAINEYLSDFTLDSAEHTAALLYACGVVHKSKYAAASTGASWEKSIFARFGFKCVNIDGPYLGMGYYYWGYWDDDFKIHISDAGYEVLIENLEAGRSVGAAYRGHALVIDGYDRETDTFHINFGWGYNQATRWYTREEMFELQLNDFVYDLMADYVETFTVNDARLYGTGTMLRAFEQASGMVGANTVVFDSSVAGKTVELENNIKVTDETTVNGFNMSVLVTSVYTDETPACGVYSDKGGILSFHASGGSLIVSTSNEYTHAFDMSEALSGTVTADNTLIYAGRTSEGADAAAVLQALQTSRSEKTEVSGDLLDSNGWSFYGSTGNDVFTLSDSSIAVGNVSLGDGDDVLSLTGRSRLYGTIDAGNGSDSITVDSTSSISGNLSGKSKLNFVLAELEDHTLFTIKSSVSGLYSNATLSVDMSNAELGTYTLISAASGATGIEDLQNMVFTITGSGDPDFTLSINGTSTSAFADLIYEGDSLKLQVKKGSSTVKPQTQTWEKIGEATHYIVEYSTDNFGHVVQVEVNSNALDSYQLPAGSYQMRVKPEDGEWTVIEPVVAPEVSEEPQTLKSNEDGISDIFFAKSIGVWEFCYSAKHLGIAGEWKGTGEKASLFGKNKLADIIEGSMDANTLLMTDDADGDALFVDDIHSALPGSVTEQQSRIARIDEIRAGAGDDIVDMTSQRFEYTGDGLTIRGGDGNDVIWANKGDNFLFGDAGNDRIVGASGDDVIAGGIGNDRMHGGGGDDVFTFCENWGVDTVEQLATGSVTLWFASGSETNWNAETLTFTDGDNRVKVSGVTAEQVKLKFGDNGSEQHDDLESAGAFLGFTSERIFEESGNGLLASL